MSSRNSEAGSTPDTCKKPRALVHATYIRNRQQPKEKPTNYLAGELASVGHFVVSKRLRVRSSLRGRDSDINLGGTGC